MTLSSPELPSPEAAFADVPHFREIDKAELRQISRDADRAVLCLDPKELERLAGRVATISRRHLRHLDVMAAARRVQLQIKRQQRSVAEALRGQP